MKKSLFFYAAVSALMLTACSSEDATNSAPVAQNGPQAVVFDTYLSNVTRAGDAGIQTTSTLQTANKGFGVFAQYSSSASADGAYANSTNPSNFMWNEHIHFAEGAWTYAPLKYWPNETKEDSQSPEATSTYADKLSFFAYAPYVAEASGVYDGKLVDESYYDGDPAIDNSNIKDANAGGIEAVIANDATGNDPWVRYAVAAKPSKSVDLLWGVAPSGGLKYTNVTGENTTVTAGMPLLNLIKPDKDQKIKFLFQHALARLGLTVVAAVDQIAPGGTLNDQTKIAVKSVVITETTATKYLKTSGALNLKNTGAFKSLWSNTDGTIIFEVSNETDGELNPNIAYKTNAATTWGQASPWTGVTTTETPVIANSKYFMVIPNNTDNTAKSVTLQVVITYDVITKDAKLADGYSEVENVITKAVTIPAFTNNKAYNLKLILGLTSVKLDAEVADWQVDGSTEVYLPQNTAQ
jgi:hypothetical protein